MSFPIQQIHPSWQPFFEQQYTQPYFKALWQYLESEQKKGVTIYPPKALWFKAFEQPLTQIKVTIIGQDPYINANQAMGLSFSVPRGEKIPPSLVNIYKELASDLNVKNPGHGDLSDWCHQGVFLLNASLTVEAGCAGSHLKKGWQKFTLAAIDYINRHQSNTVFLAWGAFAHKCCAGVDDTKHRVIKTSHPSPLGAYKVMKTAPAFLGSKCFSQVNTHLSQLGLTTINWELTPINNSLDLL
ncbi:uracil-DNA glycosylase [Psychrobium sp. 1_MG-2023]|uniref:uracil-DNA glycosylase n=1 Tax=Psychrobium sp. 1_MG-2023 TaxID=3062624 RepID=UPI000C326D1F|nr:uracil-DNA glycosylase [Psychrobium sp. 1_MG-2023]MDP2561305.1 uracil-DNA glycosylase [Psychrobium sp. 1_MG-2023]PKF54121.1 uracil-DNA glycosylase [Alteromonadales bacterium alter-6D02]